MLPAEPATDHEIWHLAWCWERERLSRGGIRVTANQGLHSLWNLGGEPPLWEISSRFCRPQPKVSHLTQPSSDSKKALKQCQTLKSRILGQVWHSQACGFGQAMKFSWVCLQSSTWLRVLPYLLQRLCENCRIHHTHVFATIKHCMKHSMGQGGKSPRVLCPFPTLPIQNNWGMWNGQSVFADRLT